MKTKKHSLIDSFHFALNGLWVIFKNERNFKIHCLATILIIILGIFSRFNDWEWLVILLIVAMVMVAEIFNSAIEAICDLLKDKLQLEYSETRNIRNFSAGAVFLIAFFAILIGFILILNKI